MRAGLYDIVVDNKLLFNEVLRDIESPLLFRPRPNRVLLQVLLLLFMASQMPLECVLVTERLAATLKGARKQWLLRGMCCSDMSGEIRFLEEQERSVRGSRLQESGIEYLRVFSSTCFAGEERSFLGVRAHMVLERGSMGECLVAFLTGELQFPLMIFFYMCHQFSVAYETGDTVFFPTNVLQLL